MKFIPIKDNDPRSINIALEAIHKLLIEHSDKIINVESKIPIIGASEKTVIIESSPVKDNPSMKGYTPTVNVMYGEYGLIVDWKDWPGYGSSEVLYYNIYMSTDSACPISDSTLVAKEVTASPYSLTGLSKGSTYYIRLMPFGITGNGMYSETVSETVISSVVIGSSESDPTNTGELSLVPGTTAVLSDCDDTTGWTVHTGTGALSTETTLVKEGTGSLKYSAQIMEQFIILLTFAPTDLSALDYITLWLRREGDINSSIWLYFGEAAYNEQSYNVTLANWGTWYQKTWDISGIAAASRNAVQYFAILGQPGWGAWRRFYVDDIRVFVSEALKVKFSDAVYTVTVT